MFIAFAPSEYISIGSYKGNANANGAFVPTLNSLGVPIQPLWNLSKKSSSTSSWFIVDAERPGYNPTDYLLANTNLVENPANVVDLVTGGLKHRIATDPNLSATYVYMAIGTPIIDVDGRIIAGK
jgi:hypothetical protein